jgi:hypothetical protein
VKVAQDGEMGSSLSSSKVFSLSTLQVLLGAVNFSGKLKAEIPSVYSSKVLVRGAMVVIVPGQQPELNTLSVIY